MENAYIGEDRYGQRFLVIQEGAGSRYYKIARTDIAPAAIAEEYDAKQNPLLGITEEFGLAAPKYDWTYCDTRETYADPKCTHDHRSKARTMGYDSRLEKGRIVAMRCVCSRCGKITPWLKTSNHTVGGGFEYTVHF